MCVFALSLPPSSLPESLLLLPYCWTGPWTYVALIPSQGLVHPTYIPITSTAPQFPPCCKIPALSDNSRPPTLLTSELKSYLPLQPVAQVCSRFFSLPAPNLHLQSSAAQHRSWDLPVSFPEWTPISYSFPPRCSSTMCPALIHAETGVFIP